MALSPVLEAGVIAGLMPDGGLGIAAVLLAGAVDGVALGLTFLLWVEAFSLFSIGSICVCFSGAAFLAEALRLVMTLLAAPVAQCVLRCAAGAVSMALCWRSTKVGGSAATEDDESGEAAELVSGEVPGRFPWRPILLMLVYFPSFSLVLVGQGASSASSSVDQLGIAVVSAAVAACAYFAYDRFTLRPLCWIALPSMCAALLGVIGPVPWPSAPVLFLAGVGLQCISLFAYLLLFSISSRHRVNPLWLLGLTNVPDVVVKGLSGMAIDLTGIVPQNVVFEHVVSFAIIALILSSLPLVFGKDLGSTWGIVRDEEDEDGRRHLTLDQRCHELARHYGLTRREEDVLLMIAQGHDASSISDQLVLSKGTVRNHVRHVYQKLDVHSHEELLGRIAD